MKRVLLATLEYPPQTGGVAAFSANLTTTLPRENINILVNGKNKYKEGNVSSDSFFFRLFWPRWIPALYKIRKKVKETETQLIWAGQVLPLGTIAYLIQQSFGIPYCVSTYGMDVTLHAPHSRKWAVMKQVFENAHFIIAGSKFTKKAIVKMGIPGDHILVVYPCPNLKPQGPIREVMQKKEDEFVILSVGRLVKRKGQDKLIESMPDILKKHPKARLWIVGDGKDVKYLHELADKSLARKRISFFGKVSDEELRGFYQQADVFAMPSRSIGEKDVEGFGIVYVEANSFGIPVVGGNSGGVREAVEHGKSGFVVNGEDPAAITNAINYFIEHPEERKRIGEYGRERVQTVFQWNVQGAILNQLLA